MSHDHWRDYHTRWSKLRPPLRPAPEVATAIRALVAGRPGPALLLGVTPELADVAADVTAVDRSEAMIGAIWPGDGPGRRVVRGDWRSLPFEDARFACAVGDGSLNAVTHPGDHAAVWAELGRVLRPGGRVVVRVFARPEDAGSVASVLLAARRREIGSFHAFKWRLAMARCGELGTPNISVSEILAAFERASGDRNEFADVSGFSRTDVDTIDVYRGSGEIYSFPTERECLNAMPPGWKAHFTAVSGYELAERCPLLVAERLAVVG